MRRSKIEVFIHYIWATKDRVPYLEDAGIERRVHRCIQAQAEKWNCEVWALNGMPDHVHLLLKIPATVTLSHLAKQCKGVSSTFARGQIFGDAFDWQNGYAALSVGARGVSRVVAYIERQKQHHGAGTTNALWEECGEEI